MKVLVTGATGFIGGNLARELWRQGYQVRALVRPGANTLTIKDTGIETVAGDLLEPDSVRRAVEGCQALFHCAAAYTFWAKDPRSIYRVNVEGTATALVAARQAGVDKVVYTSTVGTISLPRQGLGSEDDAGDDAATGFAGGRDADSGNDAPRHLVGHYKQSKYRAERVALEMAAQGLPVVVVNPTAPVGPWDVKPTPTGRIVLDFLRGRLPAYLDTGMNLVDVADVVAGQILALERGEPGQRYLLGHRNLTLKEVLALLQEITGRAAPRWQTPFWLALAAGYLDQFIEGQLLGREPRIPLEGLKVARYPMYVTSRKAIEQLGLPQSPVEAALERAVQWFVDYGYAGRNYSTIRN